jgi:hypothetical protein
MKHSQFDDLIEPDEITEAIELICPYLSDKEELIDCIGLNCGKYRNCYKEMRYNENLNKFHRYSQLIILLLIALSLVIL